MEEYIEVSAKTKEEAIMNAAIQLGTSSDNIEYDVIQEATSGLFGIGRKPAIIRARKKKDISLDFEEAVRDPLKDISAKKSFMKKPAKKLCLKLPCPMVFPARCACPAATHWPISRHILRFQTGITALRFAKCNFSIFIIRLSAALNTADKLFLCF